MLVYKHIVILLLIFTSIPAYTQACPTDKKEALEWVNRNAESINGGQDKITEIDAAIRLDFGRKCLGDKAITYICHFKNITSLSIYNDECSPDSQLTGANFELLVQNQKLEFIDLDYNSIKIKNLKKLNKLNKLKTLKLLGNNLGSQNIKILADLRLESIVLGDNNWSRARIGDVVYFLEHTSIENVNLGGFSTANEYNELSDTVVPALLKIKSFEGIKELEVPAPLDSETFVHLANLHQLKKLNFSVLTDIDRIDQLQENTTLETVDSYLPAKSLPMLTSLKSLSRVLINKLELENMHYYSASTVKELLITERVILLDWIIQLIKLNPEKKIEINIFSQFKTSQNSKPISASQVETQLAEVCKPNQCFYFMYGDLMPIEKQ